MTWQKRSTEEKETEKDAFRTKVEGYVTHLAELTDEAAANEKIIQYLTFQARFHHYSPWNVILIMWQKPEATRIAGFNTWKSLGRFPHAGRGLKIWAPHFKKIVDDNEKEFRLLSGFHLTTVWDVSDTEGDELPTDRGVWTETEEGGEELFAQLKGVATKLGIEVHERENMGLTGGWSAGGEIAINMSRPGIARVNTIIHELAHELLHKEERKELTSATMELEAEAVSYVVATHLGIPSLAANYIALWRGRSEDIKDRLERIWKGTKTIIETLEDCEEMAA
jgi:hypothetical protein